MTLNDYKYGGGACESCDTILPKDELFPYYTKTFKKKKGFDFIRDYGSLCHPCLMDFKCRSVV